MRVPRLADVRVVVDRFEGDALDVAVTEWSWPDDAGGYSQETRDFPRKDLPPDAREGTVLGVRLVIEGARPVRITRKLPDGDWQLEPKGEKP